MSRGNRREVLFEEDADYLMFLEYVQRVKEKYRFTIHACCLMTNHFHMIIETESEDLSAIMQKTLHPYSIEYNRKYRYSGHLFEKRFTACLIDDERYFLEVSRYIHLNPVKALMVREPLDYAYSSYGLFVRTVESAGSGGKSKTRLLSLEEQLVETDRVLSCFRHNPQEQYRMFVEGKISHAEQELLIQKDMKEDDMWLPW